jgi:hypothetical protein
MLSDQNKKLLNEIPADDLDFWIEQYTKLAAAAHKAFLFDKEKLYYEMVNYLEERKDA